jgi:hypothetical protein
MWNFIFVLFEFKIQFNVSSEGVENVKTTTEFFFFQQNTKNIEDHLFGFFDKDQILYYMNIFNFIKYICYSNIKKLTLYVYYYIIQIFLIVVYNNMPNIIVKNYIYYYYTLKKNSIFYIKYVMLGYVKKWRFWRSYYRFYHIDYLKFLFFLLFIILFFLMWKRRNTYLKRAYFWNLLLFYMFSIFISFLLWPLFYNKCLSVCISLIISFFLIFFRLN